MQYIITFLLVTGTTSQIVQSVADDQLQNTGIWISPAFKEQIIWLKDTAIGDIMDFSSNMKDKIISVFNFKPYVPNTEMVNDKVSEVKIVTTTVTTDNGEEIIPPDSKTVIMTKKSETTETEMSPS